MNHNVENSPLFEVLSHNTIKLSFSQPKTALKGGLII